MGQLKSERSRGKSEEDGRSYVVSKDQARGPAGWQGQGNTHLETTRRTANGGDEAREGSGQGAGGVCSYIGGIVCQPNG